MHGVMPEMHLEKRRGGGVVWGMKTMPLSQLLREPGVVKQLTAKGESLQVTENGYAIWLVSPPHQAPTAPEVDAGPDSSWWSANFEELESEPVRAGKTAAEILLESRGQG